MNPTHFIGIDPGLTGGILITEADWMPENTKITEED